VLLLGRDDVCLVPKTGSLDGPLVFGSDRGVPIMWLEGYGSLLSHIASYFVAHGGDPEELVNPASETR